MTTVSTGLRPGPSLPVGRRWVAALSVANVAVFVAFYGPLQVLLAEQAQEVAPDSKEAVLGLVTGVGAAASMISNPLFGAISDRTTSRFGRRRPWVLVGALGGAVGLTVLSGVQAVVWMVLGWALVQTTVNAGYAAIMASIPDQVPRTQRGVVGGWVALAQTVGAMVGTGIALVTGGWAAGYLACAVFLVAASAPLLLSSADQPLAKSQRPAFELQQFLKEFWVSPRQHPDFAWAWITRFLVQLGNALGLVYLYYYLQDGVGHGSPDSGVFVLTVTYAVASILTTVVSGALSDRTGRRKVFVSVSGVVMGVATAMLALVPQFGVVVLAAAILGLGFGVFMAVDYAIMTEVLPTAADAGRDLGVINIAAALPQVLAPAIAAPVVALLGGYPVLYALAACLTVLGAVLVVRIRSVP